jgi:hypothetical protein
VAFGAGGKTIAVAERGDGAVRLFDSQTFAAIGQIPLGEEADNVRIDAASGHALVGYGGGALAVIDLVARKGSRKSTCRRIRKAFRSSPAARAPSSTCPMPAP